MKKSIAKISGGLLALLFLGACASPGYHSSYPSQQYPAASQAYPATAQQPHAYPGTTHARGYGVVESIQLAQQPAQQTTGGGAVIGGVIGGLLGHQIGGGRGKTLATIGGAVGGAMLGNHVEQQNSGPHYHSYHVGVRMHDGTTRTVLRHDVQDLRLGSRVRFENNGLYPY